MKPQGAWIASLVVIALGDQAITAAQSRPSTSTPRQPSTTKGEAFFTGTVVEVYAPQLFSMRESESAGQELLVLAPRELSTVKGAAVVVSGFVRRFVARQLSQIRGWFDLDEKLRRRLSGRPVVVATAVMSSAAPTGAEAEAAPQAQTPEPPERAEAPERAPAAPLPLRTSTLADFIDALAGQSVRLDNARVVGLIAPGVFLVEPATRYLKPMGERDRLAVFIDHGDLRARPDLVVGSIVGVDGVARTLLSLQVAGEVPWPASLDANTMDRLEIRAAIVATSVHTAEGTELTNRQTSTRR